MSEKQNATDPIEFQPLPDIDPEESAPIDPQSKGECRAWIDAPPSILNPLPPEDGRAALFTDHPWLRQLSPEQLLQLQTPPAEPTAWARVLWWVPAMEFLYAMMDPRLAGVCVVDDGLQWLHAHDERVTEAHRRCAALGIPFSARLLPDLKRHPQAAAIIEQALAIHSFANDYHRQGSNWHLLQNLVHVRNFGGQGVAMSFDAEGRFQWQTAAQLKSSYPDQFVYERGADGEPTGKTFHLTDAWLRSARTPRRDRAEFLPDRMPDDDTFNLWRGWAIKPEPIHSEDPPEACTLFLEHLMDVVCGGDGEYFDYLLLWIADMLNNPWRNSEVALVMHGPMGSGKDFVADCLAELVAPHSIVIDKPNMLTGDFNSHLQDQLLVVATEALFAGNKQQADTLKGMVTTPRILYHPKGLKPFMGRKSFRLIMTSNHLQVLNVEPGDRRYFVLHVDGGPERNKQICYHGPLRKEWRQGGREAFFNWMRGDYWKAMLEDAGHAVNQRPDTVHLLKQRELSLRGPELLIHNMLMAGDAPCASLVEKDMMWVATRSLVEAGRLPDREETHLGTLLGKLSGQMDRRSLGKYEPRRMGRWLPPLKRCRELWVEHLGQTVDWPKNVTTWGLSEVEAAVSGHRVKMKRCRIRRAGPPKTPF